MSGYSWVWDGPTEDAPLEPIQTLGWSGLVCCHAKHPNSKRLCYRPRDHTGRHYASRLSDETLKWHIVTVWGD